MLLVKPMLLRRIVPQPLRYFHVAVMSVIRLPLGVLLFLAAPYTRTPALLRLLSVLTIAAAITGPLVGPKWLQRIGDWWLVRSNGILRAASVLGIALGAALFWSAY